MQFEISFGNKTLQFDSDIPAMKIGTTEYYAGADGILVYDKVANVKADHVTIQMSTNTSTLIPALKVLGISYPKYFDQRDVIESQNDITFYWKESELASFYNRFSTDWTQVEEREKVIRSAVTFLTENTDLPFDPEYLKELKDECKLLGFYEGSPIFDSTVGFARLLSSIGIHIDHESVMISTPFDRFASEVTRIADIISRSTGTQPRIKKNRVVFGERENVVSFLKQSALAKAPDWN